MIYAVAAIAVAVLAAAWLVRLRYWPWGPCLACRGRRGRGTGSTPRSWRHCRRCGGTGERLRPGARIWQRNREMDGK